MRSFELGARGTDLRKRLVAAVLRGEKTATASLRADYVPTTDEPLPKPGESFTLLGYDDEAVGMVAVSDVTIVRAGDVDLQFARDEGEGFESVAQWRSAHQQAWADREITDDTLVGCERFKLIDRY